MCIGAFLQPAYRILTEINEVIFCKLSFFKCRAVYKRFSVVIDAAVGLIQEE